MYCHTLVSPGTGAALQTAFFFNVLITLLLPTLGYPMKPTEICFFFFVQLTELTQQTDETSFAKGIVDTGVKRQRRVFPTQHVHPPPRYPDRDQITFVQHEDQMFVPCIFSQMFFHVPTARAQGVPSVQHLHHHVAAVQHFVQLTVNAVGLAFGKHRIGHRVPRAIVHLCGQRVTINLALCLIGVVGVLPGGGTGHQPGQRTAVDFGSFA